MMVPQRNNMTHDTPSEGMFPQDISELSLCPFTIIDHQLFVYFYEKTSSKLIY